jgi:hypothetical protein
LSAAEKASTFSFLVRFGAGDHRSVTHTMLSTKRITLGRQGPITPEQARSNAEELLSTIRLGGDPAAVRAAEKAAPTVAALAEKFLAEHVATKTKPRTAQEYRKLLNAVILPALGAKLVREVTRADVSRLHHNKHGS